MTDIIPIPYSNSIPKGTFRAYHAKDEKAALEKVIEKHPDAARVYWSEHNKTMFVEIGGAQSPNLAGIEEVK